jgi:hypothetical protein
MIGLRDKEPPTSPTWGVSLSPKLPPREGEPVMAAQPIEEDSFHRTLDAALRRVIACVGCKSENVAGNWNREKTLCYGRCLTCSLRFWHVHP